MIWIDYAILAVIGISGVISLMRGFVREALSLAGMDCGVLDCHRVLGARARLSWRGTSACLPGAWPSRSSSF